MELVSENSEVEIKAARALDRLRWPMKVLASNMLRVVRGAGRAYELPGQMADVLAQLEEYREEVGHYPSGYELSSLISRRHNESQHSDRWTDGIDTMVEGALQIAASMLVYQGTQERAGHSELIRGLAVIERIREANRLGLDGRTASEEELKAAREMDYRATQLGKLSRKSRTKK